MQAMTSRPPAGASLARAETMAENLDVHCEKKGLALGHAGQSKQALETVSVPCWWRPR